MPVLLFEAVCDDAAETALTVTGGSFFELAISLWDPDEDERGSAARGWRCGCGCIDQMSITLLLFVIVRNDGHSYGLSRGDSGQGHTPMFAGKSPQGLPVRA